MVLQRPLHHFSSSMGVDLMRIFKKHVRERGLGQPQQHVERRRPRTCFLTPESLDQANECDIIWHLDADTKTVRNVQASDLDEHFNFKGRCMNTTTRH
eukprot:gnl/TRDRNA2_/TRDRNA2_170647_c1_seq7.p1 gnl/TRDRNA2_/TRDRNA2_170647_c1~~gnl/TRDRNA2_/TRDRNA2_170647_c1_seq7.p1  ORF type:complete len:107 (+),score=16.24 gnl/TRDRNA2_/TRDRNA2_170647_c1_seq7:28-321(+)